MKAEADLHFLQGINQLIGHGWPYSPPSAGEPGWRFYAAAVFNQHNPWWMVMPDITRYLQRVSFLLRQGEPANDVALYLPTADAQAKFTVGHDASVNRSVDAMLAPNVIPQILEAGSNFDFIDDGAIAHGGVPYRILILPGIERIPLATYQKIEAYVRQGGIVVATRRLPALAPGLLEAETDAPRIRELSRTLFEAPGASGRLVTDEKQLGSELNTLLTPDVAKPPEIGFIHRKLAFADVYFLANTSNHPVRSQGSFRIAGLEPAWWDPFTGSVTKAGDSARIGLDLAPYESRVLVFSKDRVAERPAEASAALEPVDLSSGWKVAFSNAVETVMPNLRSWTEDEGTKYFSGQATYEKTVTMTESMAKSRHPVFLNFGEGTPVVPSSERRSSDSMRAWIEGPVREAAIVYVNDQWVGSVWRPPYEVNVSGLLHTGENKIRVVVANLAINEMARGPLPDYRLLKSRYGDRFQAQDLDNLQPLPSGLLGPIRLVAR